MQIGYFNNFGYDRMRIDKYLPYMYLSRDNFAPNLQWLIYHDKYFWRA